jgi:anti-sigma B factor antagonist
MNFEILEFRGIGIIRIVDSHASQLEAQDFKDAMINLIENQQHKNLLVDFSEVEFVDSSFLGAMVFVYRNVLAKEGKIKICGLNKELFMRFQITKLNNVFEIYNTQEDAVDSFK